MKQHSQLVRGSRRRADHDPSVSSRSHPRPETHVPFPSWDPSAMVSPSVNLAGQRRPHDVWLPSPGILSLRLDTARPGAPDPVVYDRLHTVQQNAPSPDPCQQPPSSSCPLHTRTPPRSSPAPAHPYTHTLSSVQAFGSPGGQGCRNTQEHPAGLGRASSATTSRRMFRLDSCSRSVASRGGMQPSVPRRVHPRPHPPATAWLDDEE
ncbi:hypothetical protein VTK73DRAFT_4251 [Phialemonium thermophilum]|uniref:Uncharacterized protein n=1 Tax=Phialemonium thermophilum TaxID=223376 RepID=A0ABR3VAF0_9PEZI